MLNVISLTERIIYIYSGLQLGKVHKEIMNHRWTQMDTDKSVLDSDDKRYNFRFYHSFDQK